MIPGLLLPPYLSAGYNDSKGRSEKSQLHFENQSCKRYTFRVKNIKSTMGSVSLRFG